MPNYVFKKQDGSTIELFFNMNNVPKIGEYYTLENGEKVKRLATISIIKESVPSDIYDIDKLSKFSTPNETIGDTMKRSEELSQKRAEQNGGVDPVQKKFFKEYSKKRKGKKHPKDID